MPGELSPTRPRRTPRRAASSVVRWWKYDVRGQQRPEPNTEDRIGVQVAQSRPGAPAVLTIGGLNSRPGIPNWEFARTLDRDDVQLVFVRDLRQAWYQRGIADTQGFTGSVREIAGVVEQLDAPRVSIVGSSAGGILGLHLSAALPNAHRTLLFTPQTTIHPLDRLRMRDTRWQRRVLSAYRSGDRSLRVPGDLDFGACEVRIVVGGDHRLDLLHAARVPGAHTDILPGVGAHMVARHLRDEGRLDDYISWLIEDPSPAD